MDVKFKILAIGVICLVCAAFFVSCEGAENTVGNSAEGSPAENGGSAVAELGKGEVTDTYSAFEIAGAVMALYGPEELPAAGMSWYFSGEEEESENYIEPEMIGNYIYGTFSPVAEMEYLEDFVFCIPGGKNVFEVDVFKIKKSEQKNIGAVQNILETRLKRKDNGDVVIYVPEDVPLIKNAEVIVAGPYAILLATTDNSKAVNLIDEMLYRGSAPSAAPEVGQGQTGEAGPKPVLMDEVVNIESEIKFDLGQFANPPTGETAPQDPSPEEEPSARRTAVPSVSVKSYSHNTSFLIGGKCEPGANIRVTGGTEEIYTGSHYGDYLVEVPFSAEGASVLKLTAELSGKLPSEEISFIVKAQKNVSYYEDSGIYGVVIGYNYMSYFDDCLPDFLGTNLIAEKDIESIKTRTAKKIQDLRDKGCNAEIIYLLSPNPMKVWPEDVPKRYTEFKGDSLLRQWKEGVTAGGAVVIDLSDVMMERRDDEFKIWHKTDSHWSEYGALIAYEELMGYIGQRYPDAAPRPRSDFEIYNKEVNFGDIYATLGLSLSDMCETSTFVEFKFDPPHYNPDYDTGHVNIYDQDCSMRMSVRPLHVRVQFDHTTETNLKGLNLPSAYFFRDSFEGPLHAFYTDRFSRAKFKGMWDYRFNANDIAKENPDYIIYVVNERNIKNVMYE
ncbi:MAG: DUF4358 domain-containing protein [Oscillospiraceae bacterium]|nr:DUF4358 domain-containing protein [Oscillospiraceae bacterium]